MADKQRLTQTLLHTHVYTHTESNQTGFTMCSLEPNCSSGPCAVLPKPLVAAVLRKFSVCHLSVCVCFGLWKMNVHIASVCLHINASVCGCVCVCTPLFACRLACP